jgi:TIR domain
VTIAAAIFVLGYVTLWGPILIGGGGGHVPLIWFLLFKIAPALFWVAIGMLAVWGWTVWSRKRLEPISKVSTIVPPEQLPDRAEAATQVFVSYSHQDKQTVDQLVDQIEKLGYTVWIDRQSTGSQRYAAAIVRAIRSSRLVALMCSAHAFTSDHVLREVYIAGDYKKPFIAFQLDPTEFPDQFVYFISGFPRITVASLDRDQLRSEIARLAVIS